MTEITWIFTRLLEVTADALLITLLLDPPQGALAPHLLGSASLALLYCILSGYAVSTVIFGYVLRCNRPWVQATMMATLFALHAAGFLLTTDSLHDPKMLWAMTLAALCVLVINHFTETRRHRRHR